ncbi:DUF7139 domain-containing protein [Haloferacaceae archaeon DSL9]
MTSLSEAYSGPAGSRSGLRRLYLGIGLFLAGALLVVSGILAAGTGLLTARGYGMGQARWYGGVLGGVGVPVVFLGIFSVLPSERSTRAAAVLGASLALLGVTMYAHAYPCQWIGSACGEGLADLTLPTAGVYFVGVLATFWCLFVGVANFKTRNDPGGTATVEVTRRGETRIVEVERPSAGPSGVGFLGATPDGTVETQTNAVSTTGNTASTTSEITSATNATASPVSDGGETTTGVRSLGEPSADGDASADASPSAAAAPTNAGWGVGAEPTAADRAEPLPTRDAIVERKGNQPTAPPLDTYCGSCRHFRYVRDGDGMRPYCGLDDEAMDDVSACDGWTRR